MVSEVTLFFLSVGIEVKYDVNYNVIFFYDFIKCYTLVL